MMDQYVGYLRRYTAIAFDYGDANGLGSKSFPRPFNNELTIQPTNPPLSRGAGRNRTDE